MLVVDCYSHKYALSAHKPGGGGGLNRDPHQPPNLFNTEQEYGHFCEIYSRWKERSMRNRNIIQADMTKFKVRQNDSFSSFSSASG